MPIARASNVDPAAREFLGNFYVASLGNDPTEPVHDAPEVKRRRLLFPNPQLSQPLRIAGNSEISRLVMQPFDVQEIILSLLPNASLATLRLTCQHFAETAGRSLVQRTRTRELNCMPKVSSFIHFLNSRWSTLFRCLVQELHFSPIIKLVSPEAIYYYDSFAAKLGRSRREWRMERFVDILSRLPCLEDLSIDIPPTAFYSSFLVKLLNLPLRRLVLNGSGTVSIPFHALHASLESLELLNTRVWKVPPTVVLPALQSLTTCLPVLEDAPSMVAMKTILPGLKHLHLVGSILQHPCRQFPTHLETLPELHRLRLAYRHGWDARPDNWPNLLSITADSPDHLYALAIPRRVPHIAVKSGRMSVETGFMLGSVAADAQPYSMEYTWERDRELDDEAKVHHVRNIFELLPEFRSLKRCTLTLVSSGWNQRFKNRDEMIECCLKHIPRWRLTHLLIKDQDSHFAIPQDNRLGPRRSRADQVRLVETETRSLVTRLAKASPTLLWIGIAVSKHPLKVWRVRRAAGVGTCRERVDEVTMTMPEGERWAIFDAVSTSDQ
ncbi:hypothetical protein ACG7TL_008880 [Trametes sanguinea]